MTIDEQIKISTEVTNQMVNICKLNGVDFMSLDKKVRDSMIQIFQLGVGFIKNYTEKGGEKNG